MGLAQAKRLFFLGLVTSLSATAALAIAFLLFGEIDETTERILMTTGLIGLFSLVALPAGVLLDQRRFVWLAWTVIGLSAGSFLLALALVWQSWDDDPSDAHWKSLLVLTTFAAASSQVAGTTSRRRAEDPPSVRWLYLGSIALAALFAALVTLAVLMEIDREGFYRFLAAVAVADLLFVVLQSVVRRMSGVPRGGVGATYEVLFRLTEEPSDEALRAASEAFASAGARVERVDRRP